MWEFITTQLDWVVFAFFMLVALVLILIYRERLISYIRDVRQEWNRVSTPSREQTISHTGVVLVGVAISAAFLFVVDWFLGQLMRLFYSL